MEIKFTVSLIEIFEFMNKIDNLFPVKLSDKQDLKLLASKYIDFGSLMCLYDNNSLVSLLVGYINDDKHKIAYVSVLAVLPEYQGNGYASMLLDEFEKKCKQKDMRRIELFTHKTNLRAIKMYKRCGFTVDGIDKTRPHDIKFYKDL